ncbi:o-succinylbenzoate synthase [Cryomorpha ignava]|uniref:O-succinylbenzoate synthase n=2 Tax=Cryomorpha ignava TaxID=101383 RepID=A0A7K3WPH3_9FLAO|nr:o-succinylbenzoate synthase [Cryomorpha ignava]
MTAYWKKHNLEFTTPRGTSRGIMSSKPSYFLILNDGADIFVGECGLLPGLSIDDREGYESLLNHVVSALMNENKLPDLTLWPSIQCGLENLELHRAGGSFQHIFNTPFSSGDAGIEINGLVWMDKAEQMFQELNSKLETGYTCVKLKIGAIDFNDEINLLKHIRKQYTSTDVVIRVDANGAFSANDAYKKLSQLAALDIHSIEQPIKAGQWNEMAELCAKTPLPIALDEELIGLTTSAERQIMMETIKPQAIILKPSLIGGFKISDEWIELAEEHDAFWWATSALESNVGLNAIAQYTASKNPKIAQGLGTGMLYTNNISSPLEIRKNKLFYNPEKEWEIPFSYEPV